MKKISFFLIVLCFLIIGFWGWKLVEVPKIEVVIGIVAPAVQVVYATGVVEPMALITLSPTVSANITKLYAQEGDEVKAGKVLVQLNNEEINAALLVQKAQTVLARKKVRRLKKSIDNVTATTVSAMEYDQVSSELIISKANENKLQAQKNNFQLRSPKDGVIIKREGEEGQLAAMGAPIYWIATDSRLRVSAQIDEEDIPLIKSGQRALLSNTAFPNQVQTGVVAQITPLGDASSRSFRLRINLPEDSPFRMGMTAEVNVITLEKEKALLIPITAVEASEVWKWQPKKQVFTRTKVLLGITAAKKVEILDGISKDDVIAKSAAAAKKYKGRAKPNNG